MRPVEFWLSGCPRYWTTKLSKFVSQRLELPTVTVEHVPVQPVEMVTSLARRHARLFGRLPSAAQRDGAGRPSAVVRLNAHQAPLTADKLERGAGCRRAIERHAIGGEAAPRSGQVPGIGAPVDHARRMLAARAHGRRSAGYRTSRSDCPSGQWVRASACLAPDLGLASAFASGSVRVCALALAGSNRRSMAASGAPVV